MKKGAYLITVMLLLSPIFLRAQKLNKQTIHADEQKVLEIVAGLEMFQWVQDAALVYHFGPQTADFYRNFTRNGKWPEQISDTDMAGVALVAIKALAEKNQEFSENQRLLNESVERLNEATEKVIVATEEISNLQAKITDLEYKLMNLESKVNELETDKSR